MRAGNDQRCFAFHLGRESSSSDAVNLRVNQNCPGIRQCHSDERMCVAPGICAFIVCIVLAPFTGQHKVCLISQGGEKSDKRGRPIALAVLQAFIGRSDVSIVPVLRLFFDVLHHVLVRRVYLAS